MLGREGRTSCSDRVTLHVEVPEIHEVLLHENVLVEVDDPLDALREQGRNNVSRKHDRLRERGG